MPTYQYQCADCGEALEIHQSFSDESLTECPACGGNLRKVFGAVGVVFKGSGFYKNDSRPKDSSTTSSTSSSSESSTTPASTSSSSPAKSDSTPSKAASTSSASSSSDS